MNFIVVKQVQQNLDWHPSYSRDGGRTSGKKTLPSLFVCTICLMAKQMHV